MNDMYSTRVRNSSTKMLTFVDLRSANHEYDVIMLISGMLRFGSTGIGFHLDPQAITTGPRDLAALARQLLHRRNELGPGWDERWRGEPLYAVNPWRAMHMQQWPLL